MALGDRIKEARKDKGYTQRQLAELINAKHNSISNWENNQNKPDPDTIELICGILDVTPTWLLSGINIDEEKRKITIDTRDLRTPENLLLSYFNKLNGSGKKQAIKRLEELTYIPKYCEATPEYLQPIAAHNDFANDEEQQRLMKEDLDDL